MLFYKQVIQNTLSLYEQECTIHSIHYSPNLLWIVLLGIQRNRCKNLMLFVENNIFLDAITKKIIMYIYIKSVSCFHVLTRMVVRYKRRHMKSCNTDDLSCTPLHECKQSDLFDLVVDQTKYTFKQSDMYNIIQSSITHADEFMISIPLQIKNPYTGIPFTKLVLYKLFMLMKQVPPLFMYYMKCDFDPDLFLVQYEGILRTYTIQKTIQEYSKKNIRIIIEDMLMKTTLYNILTGLHEPIVLAKDIKVDLCTLKPLLHYYYNYLFSLNPYQRHVEHKKLLRALLKLRKNQVSLLMYAID